MTETARHPSILPAARVLGSSALSGLAVLVVAMAVLAGAGCSTTPPTRGLGIAGPAGIQAGTVVVRAEGSVEVVPDIAVLGIGVEITEPAVAAARARAAQVADTVIAALERQGVAEDDLRTSRFSIQPEYRYSDDGRRRLTGYRVVHALTVTYRDLDTVGAAIDAVSQAGGDALAFRDISFTYSDPERHFQAARRAAVLKLHDLARQLAGAANRELGPLLEISEGVVDSGGPYRGPDAGAALLRAEAVDTPISIGTDIVTVTVRGVFALR